VLYSHQERNSAFFGPFGPGRERTVLILSKRARLRTDDAVRLSSIPIAAYFHRPLPSIEVSDLLRVSTKRSFPLRFGLMRDLANTIFKR